MDNSTVDRFFSDWKQLHIFEDEYLEFLILEAMIVLIGEGHIKQLWCGEYERSNSARNQQM